MATSLQDLSVDVNELPQVDRIKVGIVISEWNKEITQGLLDGALAIFDELSSAHKEVLTHWVPGSFELPLGAQWLFESHQDIDGIICIGSVIRGETAHFDFVCHGVTQGVMDVNLKFSKPAVFCLLTDDNWQQAKDRSGGKHGNKGADAASVLVKMIHMGRSLKG